MKTNLQVMQIFRLVFPHWKLHRLPAVVLPKGSETLSFNKYSVLQLPSLLPARPPIWGLK